MTKFKQGKMKPDLRSREDKRIKQDVPIEDFQEQNSKASTYVWKVFQTLQKHLRVSGIVFFSPGICPQRKKEKKKSRV